MSCTLSVDQIGQLREIESRCHFRTTKEKQDFYKKVTERFSVSNLRYINTSQFEDAKEYALELLREEGARVVGGKIDHFRFSVVAPWHFNRSESDTLDNEDDPAPGFFN